LHFDKAAVAQALAEYSFSPDNERFLRYWLSLWTEDGAPVAGAPLDTDGVLRNCVTFSVRASGSVRVTHVGEAIVAGLGRSFENTDFMLLAQSDNRDVRLERFTRTAAGTLFRYRRRAVRLDGRAVLLEEIAAPLGPPSPQVRQTVTHVDISALRPSGRVRPTPELLDTVELAEPLLDLRDFRREFTP